MLHTTAHAYIVTDDQILAGEPIIRGTRTPVRAIVEDEITTRVCGYDMGSHPGKGIFM